MENAEGAPCLAANEVLVDLAASVINGVDLLLMANFSIINRALERVAVVRIAVQGVATATLQPNS